MSAGPGNKNPYRPGAAIAPLHLAGRSKPIRNFERTLAGSPELPANMKLTGLRGVGKSVLLKEFERRAENEFGWLCSRIQIEPRHNSDNAVTTLIADLCEQASQKASRTERIKAKLGIATTVARNLITFSYEDFNVSLAGNGTNTDSITKALFETASTALSKGHTGYLVMLDEAQILRDENNTNGQHPLSLLIAAVNTLQEEEIPVGLALCGLPTLNANLLKARTYTERMFRGEEIGKLNTQDAIEAFAKPLQNTGITATDALVERVVREVEGYPFFIQLWGDELWVAASETGINELTEELLEQVEPDIYERLDNDFYRQRIESLTPAEQDLIAIAAKCRYPPLRSAEIQRNSKKSGANVNVLMGRLAEQGIIYRTQKGTYEFTAPKFYDYLQRRTTTPPSQ